MIENEKKMPSKKKNSKPKRVLKTKKEREAALAELAKEGKVGTANPPVKIYLPGDNPGIDIEKVPLLIKPDEYEAVSIHQARLTTLSPMLREYGSEGISGLIPGSVKIPTPNGLVKVKDLKSGDEVFGANGKPIEVNRVEKFTRGKVVKFTIKDGRTFHVYSRSLVLTRAAYSESTTRRFIHASDMLEMGALKSRGFNWAVPLCYPVDYPNRDLPLHPYIMGIVLGDGCKNDGDRLEVSSDDLPIVDVLARELKAERYKQQKNCYTWTFFTGEPSGWGSDGRYHYGNTLRFRDIAPGYEKLLSGIYAIEKWIPEEYLIASEKQRLQLLCGLMDSEGNIYKRDEDGEADRYTVAYSSTSVGLLSGVQQLIWSLGGSANISVNKTPERNGVKNTQYTLRLNVDPTMKRSLFQVPRKKEVAEEAYDYVARKDYSKTSIVDVSVGNDFCDIYRIVTNASDHLFLTENYIVMHDGSFDNIDSNVFSEDCENRIC